MPEETKVYISVNGGPEMLCAPGAKIVTTREEIETTKPRDRVRTFRAGKATTKVNALCQSAYGLRRVTGDYKVEWAGAADGSILAKLTGPLDAEG